MVAWAGAMLVGLLVGLRHAFEPDHLTAISTLVVDARSARGGALLGMIWGIGHTLALVVVGSALVATGAVLSPDAAALFELLVAAMLVVLGVRSIVRAARDRDDHTHTHDVHRARALRPLIVGLVHGLAGSGAITALVFAELPSNALRVVYIALFGLGSIAGMAIASGLAGMTLRTSLATPGRRRALGIATGALSIVLGIVWAIPELALIS